MSLELKFIGTGGAFDHEQGNAAALVTLDGRRLLLDCGSLVYAELRRRDLVDALDGVIISHLHEDHVGSLSTLLFHRHFFPPTRQLPVYCGERLLPELLTLLGHGMQDATQYATFEPAEALPGVTAIDTSDRHVPGMVTYGFAFTEGDNCIAISGDLGDADFFFDALRERGLSPRHVFHDLTFIEGVPAHAWYGDVKGHADVLDIVGYHHDHRQNPADNPIRLAGACPEFLL